MNNRLLAKVVVALLKRHGGPSLVEQARLREAMQAIHGPPPTPDELRDAERTIDKQRQRDLQG